MNKIELRISKTTMSSRQIAEVVETTHDSVLKTIRALIERGVVSGNETPYVHPQNGQVYNEFLLDFRNTMVIVSGYSHELRARIIDRWQQLEIQAANPFHDQLPKNMAQALRLSAKLLDEKEELEARVKILEPKAEALDRIADADGEFCITDAAKNLQIQPKKLFSFLLENNWIYQRPGAKGWLARQERIHQLYLVHRTYTITKHDGSEKHCHQVKVTPRGLARLALILNARDQNGCATN